MKDAIRGREFRIFSHGSKSGGGALDGIQVVSTAGEIASMGIQSATVVSPKMGRRRRRGCGGTPGRLWRD